MIAAALGATATVFASCFACGGPAQPRPDGGRDGGADAGADAGPADGGGDAGKSDDAGPVDAGATSLEVQTSLEALSTTPCPDWEVVPDLRPRALPADPTPRQLWRWRAYDDPVYLASGLLNTYLRGGPSIGPDGHLYIIGPERDRVMSVTRAGAMRWLSDPVGGFLLPTIAIAPDGDLFVGHATEGAPFGLLRFSPDGALAGGSALGGPSFDLAVSPDVINGVTVGPGGMVYVAAPGGRVVATCRDGRVMWVLTVRYLATGRPAWVQAVLVDGAGTLWLSGVFHQAFRLDADGRILQTITDAASDSVGSDSVALYVRALGAGQEVLFHEGRLGENVLSAILWADGAVVHRFPGASDYLLDPLGGVWQITRDPVAPAEAAFSRWMDGTQQWRFARNVLTPFGWPGAWASDASRVEGRLGGGVRRVLPTGLEAWGHAFTPLGGPTADPYAINLDVDGVAFVESGGDLFAFQTDVLPPAGAGCWDAGCNRRRNNWAGSP